MTYPPLRVSVVIPVYNGAAFLDETVASALAQDLTDFEILIVDDGSTDGSLEQAEVWAARHPGRVRVLTHSGHANRGVSASRNLAMSEAKADLFALLDADDVWPATKLSQQLALFDRHPALDLVGGAALYWGSWEGGRDRLVPVGHRQDQVISPPDAALEIYPLGKAQAPCPSTLMIRRGLIDRIGGFEEAFVGPYALYEDQALLSKCYVHGRVLMASATYCRYRQHRASIMASVLGSGRYDEVRRFFLDWFAGYLAHEGISDPRLTAKLTRARMRYGNPVQRLLARALGR